MAARRANAFGLYDMTGNVWEWVEDADSGQGRVFRVDDTSRRPIRGGSWYNEWPRSRISNRLAYPASRRDDDLGFRVAR
jgi:formylglycine-generating enzyme required for sulfatase activity